MNEHSLFHIVCYRFAENSYALLQHNLSDKDSEERVNELDEQRLPAFRGRQTAAHEGDPQHCPRCKRAAAMVTETLYNEQIARLEKAVESFDSRALRAMYRKALQRTGPARHI